MKQFFTLVKEKSFINESSISGFYTDSTKTGFIKVERVERMLLHHF